MRQSESIAKLAEAMVKFQSKVEAAKKDSTNPHFKSKYADITAVLDACRAPLAENGLSVIQMPMMMGERPVLTTRLMHMSGEWLEGEWPLNPVKNDPQGLGAASTYARRYSLMAALGIATEDDDGETASGRGNGQAQQRAPARAPSNQTSTQPVNDSDREEARKLMKLITGEISRCEAPEDVDAVMNDNAGDIERIGKASAPGKETLLSNAAKQRAFLAQHKEAA